MSFTVIIVVAVLALGVVLFLVKRAVGMFIKLVLVGLMLLLLLGGALAWRWYAPASSSSPQNTRPQATPRTRPRQ